MANKVLGAYVVADLAFVITGAILVGFCVIVQNKMFEAPTDGSIAVENLLYQMFPLTGMDPTFRPLKWNWQRSGRKDREADDGGSSKRSRNGMGNNLANMN